MLRNPCVDDWSAVGQSDSALLLQARREYDADELVARSQVFFDPRATTTYVAAIRLSGRL